jgi:hypothetical protein
MKTTSLAGEDLLCGCEGSMLFTHLNVAIHFYYTTNKKWSQQNFPEVRTFQQGRKMIPRQLRLGVLLSPEKTGGHQALVIKSECTYTCTSLGRLIYHVQRINLFPEEILSNQPNQLNLANLFQSVVGSLSAQRETLNSADTYNHDHGDNMVQIFNVISQAMQEKKNATPADQVEYASQLLRQQSSGSAQVYAQGLSQAAKEFQGQKQVTPNNAISLIQALLGGGQASTAQSQGGVGDLLGSLMGGGQAAAAQPQAQDGLGDLLGSLLGGGQTAPTQSQAQQQGQAGLDMGDLLNAGMAFMNTKAQGGNTMQALSSAIVSGSAMGSSQHRSQSGAVVVNSLLQALGGMMGSK